MHRMICFIVGLCFFVGQARADSSVDGKALLAVPASQGERTHDRLAFNAQLAEADRLESSGRNLRTLGIISGLIGAGALGYAGYLFLRERHDLGDGALGLIVGIAGAPLTIGGLVMLNIGHSRIGDAQRLRESAVSISPTVTPVPGGAMVGLRLVHF